MFGMGFTEILIIAVIAVLFLGPDKLPSTMIEIAKFFRTAKNAVGSVKDTIEEEMHVSEIKKEALAYKDELTKASTSVTKMTDLNSILEDDDVDVVVDKKESSEDIVTFKKNKTLNKKEEIKDV